MPYTNTIVTTSTGGTWNSGTGLSYSTITLIDGIPHSAQLEVERVFTEPRSTGDYATIEDFLNNAATTQKDKQQVFIIPASRITFNETSKTITAIDLPSTGNTYDFNPDGAGLANVPVPAIVSGTSVLKVRRKTVSNETLVTWSAGSKLTSAQLNLEVKQLIYLIQELIDKTTTEVNVSNTTIGTVTNYSITPIKLSAGGPTWLSSGSVGIGTTNPSQKLHVYGGTIRADNTTGSSGDISLIVTGGPSGSGSNLQVLHETGNSLVLLNSGSPGGNFLFRGSGGTSMRIDTSGNVGIGAASTGNKLRVAVTGTGTGGIEVINTDTSAYGTMHVNGTSGGIASWANGFVIEGVPYSTGNTILSSYTNALTFQTSRAERMRIDSSGALIHGATTSGTTGAISLVPGGSSPTINKLVFGTDGTGYKFAIASKNAGNASVDRLLIEDNGQVEMPANISASSTTTGTLVVTGGVGVSGTVYAGGFNGPLTGNVTGNVTGSSGSCTGNAATATTATNLTTNGIGQTVSFSTTWAGTGSPSGFTKTASSATLSLPTGTWQGFSMAQTATAGSAVTIVSHNSATTSITLAVTASLVNCWVVLTRTA